MSKHPPIALFVYNRPDHVRQTLLALKKNVGFKDYPLYIFSDAPKKETDESAVMAVRQIITNDDLNYTELIQSERNMGLAESIIGGVSRLVNEYGSVIVLEDDLITTPHFLEFMRNSLDYYKSDRNVMHVNGFSLPTGLQSHTDDVYSYRQALSWGWATWQDRWTYFENDATILLKELQDKHLLEYFDIDGAFRFSSTLRANIRGDIHTWAIKWYASIVLQGGTTITPYCSLVKNIGNDASGTNAKKNSHFNTNLCLHLPNHILLDVTEKKDTALAMGRFYLKIRPGLWEKVTNRVKYWLRRNKI